MYLFDVAMALARPDIHVRLKSNGKIAFDGTSHQLLDYPCVETIQVSSIDVKSDTLVIYIIPAE